MQQVPGTVIKMAQGVTQLQQKKFKYSEKLKAIRLFINIPFKHQRDETNYSAKEKQFITREFNKLFKAQHLMYLPDENKITAREKFIRSKKKAKGKYSKGYFVAGSKPSDIVNKAGEIVRKEFTKKFIPLDLSEAPFAASSEKKLRDFIHEVLVEAFNDIEVEEKDYFSIKLINGFEVGQNQKAKIPQKQWKEPRSYAQSGTKGRRITTLSRLIASLTIVSQMQYESLKKQYNTNDIVTGVYQWKFLHQRQPTKQEKKRYAKKTPKRKPLRRR